nr:hypothetical protein Itr_chr03CG07410 [Ipomoea trifida]
MLEDVTKSCGKDEEFGGAAAVGVRRSNGDKRSRTFSGYRHSAKQRRSRQGHGRADQQSAMASSVREVTAKQWRIRKTSVAMACCWAGKEDN